MQLLAEEQGDCLVVTVAEDRIDAGSAVQFKEAMRTAIEGESPRVVLDLSSVDSIAPSPLESIESTEERSKTTRGDSPSIAVRIASLN